MLSFISAYAEYIIVGTVLTYWIVDHRNDIPGFKALFAKRELPDPEPITVAMPEIELWKQTRDALSARGMMDRSGPALDEWRAAIMLDIMTLPEVDDAGPKDA